MKLERFEWRRAAKNFLLAISLLVILDLLVYFLGASYLSRNVGAFLGKKEIVILSDLFFLEGALIVAVGAFFAVAIAMQQPKPASEMPAEQDLDSEQTHRKRVHPSVIMVLIGIVLIVLSVAVGTLGTLLYEG